MPFQVRYTSSTLVAICPGERNTKKKKKLKYITKGSFCSSPTLIDYDNYILGLKTVFQLKTLLLKPKSFLLIKPYKKELEYKTAGKKWHWKLQSQFYMQKAYG